MTKKRVMTVNGEMPPDAGDTIRNAVLKRMHERDVSAWHLAMLSGVPYDTVRRFVSGTHDTSTTKASLMLTALNSDHPDWTETTLEDSKGNVEKILVRCTKDPTSETTN